MPKSRRQMVIPGFNSEIQILNQTQDHARAAIFSPVVRSQRPNIDEINFHFGQLKEVARRRAPHTLRKIDHLHRIVLDHAHGRISDYAALERIATVIRNEGLDPTNYHHAKNQLDALHQVFRKSPNYTFMNLNDQRGPRLPAANRPLNNQSVHPFLRQFLPRGPIQARGRQHGPIQPLRPPIEQMNWLRKKRRPPVRMPEQLQSPQTAMAKLKKHLPSWF